MAHKGSSLREATSGRLAQLVRDEVKAQMKRHVMARARDEFVNRLVEVLIPALRHHYRAALGVLNHRPDQVDKWRQQSNALLDQFADRLQEKTKAKGLDRRKAVAQAVKELLDQDEARVRLESLTFQKSYQLKSLTPISSEAREEFLSRVRQIVDTLFPG
jgi:hypothetical protein